MNFPFRRKPNGRFEYIGYPEDLDVIGRDIADAMGESDEERRARTTPEDLWEEMKPVVTSWQQADRQPRKRGYLH